MILKRLKMAVPAKRIGRRKAPRLKQTSWSAGAAFGTGE